jgi:DNA replication protein DnaC
MMKNDHKISDDPLAHIRKYLQTLKLYRMEESLDEELTRAARENLPVSNVIERLLAIETNALIERRIERRIKESRLPERKLLSDFDFAFQTGVDKGQVMELAAMSFVERKQGLILAGSSGTGKSHISKALLLIGCQRLYWCRYTTAADMLKDLLASLSDDSLEQKLKIYTRPQILLIDEIGFDRLEQESARNASLFFKVIDSHRRSHGPSLYYHYYSRTKLENVRIKKTQQPYLPLAHQRKTPHQNLNHTSPKPYTPWQHGDC